MAKNDSEKDFFKFMNIAVFGETTKNMRKQENISLTKIELFRLRTKLSYYKVYFLLENLLAIEMRKTQILMNKSVYLGLSILELSKIVM